MAFWGDRTQPTMYTMGFLISAFTTVLKNLACGRNSGYFSWVLKLLPSLGKATFLVLPPITPRAHVQEPCALPRLIYLLCPEHSMCIYSICVLPHSISVAST